MQRFANGMAVISVVLNWGFAGCALAAYPAEAQNSFINSAAQAGMLEVEAAKVAVSASRNVAVREFAYRIIYDYEKMNSDLSVIAGKRGISVPAGLDAEHAKILQSLRDTPPQSFDSWYFTTMVVVRGKMVELLQSNLLNPDSELTVFSSYNLPRVKEHKRLGEELKAGLPR
jgi:putative membrane protein